MKKRPTVTVTKSGRKPHYFLVFFLKKKGTKNTDKAPVKPAIMLLVIKYKTTASGM